MSNRARQRRRERRRARMSASHAAYEAGMRAGPKMPHTVSHYLAVDATQSQMDRSPTAARIGVVLGAMVFLGTMLWWLLGLLLR